MRSYRSILSALLVPLFMVGCLNEKELVPKRMTLNFQVDGVGGETGELTAEGDTLNITQVKYYLNSFILETGDGARLQANIGVVLRYRTQDAGDDVRSFAGDLGYDEFSTFDGMEFFIQPPPDSVSVPDQDLVESGERYSVAIRGSYNGSDFLYRSKANLNENLTFDSGVTIGADAETLRVLLLTSIGEIFMDSQSGRILSPVDPADSSQIVTNIEQSLQVEASAERFLPSN